MSQCCEINILRRREKWQIFSFLPLPTDPGSAKFLTAPSATTNKFLNQTKTVYTIVPVSPFNYHSFRKKYFFKKVEWVVFTETDIDGSLAGISDFSEDIVSKTGSDSGGISSLDGSKSDTGI